MPLSALTGVRPPLPNAYERPVGVLSGMVNGALTGLIGSFVFPGAMFLHGLRLDRRQFSVDGNFVHPVNAGAARPWQVDTLTRPVIGAWAAPAMIGMVIGSHIWHLLTETQFRRVFFASVLGLGLAIVNSAIWWPATPNV